MSNRVVLDASAILAMLFREQGSEIVENYIETSKAVVSSINVSEVFVKQLELSIPNERTIGFLGLLGIEVVDFNMDMAIQAAALRKLTKEWGLSFGDRACLALGQAYSCPVITADRAWGDMNLGIEVILIR